MRSKMIGSAAILVFAGTPVTGLSQITSAPTDSRSPAQWHTTVAVLVGAFNDDIGGDHYFPFAAARLSRDFGRYALWELGLSYAASKETIVVSRNGTLSPRDVASPVITGDVGVQLKYPIGPVEPYAGVAIGIFARNYENRALDRETGASRAANFGLRFRMGERFSMRTEIIRLRSDDYGDFAAFNYEHAMGVSFLF